MTHRTLVRPLAAALTAALLVSVAEGGDREHAAPPPMLDDGASPALLSGGKAMATTQYSQGDPTDQEQLFLEYMNRCRLDPGGEADLLLQDYGSKPVRDAVQFFLKERPGVEYSRSENHDAFDALPAVQPFAFHPALLTAARNHSRVMQTVDQQVHRAVGESTLRERTTAAGYQSFLLGESIYAFAKNMLHAHAGFAVDWGQRCHPDRDSCLPGERPLTGHRDALMGAVFREVGVGVIADDDRSTNVGPLLITIDFAEPQDDTNRLVTGVVYEDLDDDGFYSLGEGIAGVRIETDASDFFAVSTSSGGYAVPVPRDSGQVRVFAMGEPGTPGEAVAEQEVVVQVTDENVKVDFGPKPEPAVPAITEFPGSVTPIADGATTSVPIPVDLFDPDNPTVGDVELEVAIDYGSSAGGTSGLDVVLVSPSGTRVLLFDGGPSGHDLRGTFGRTLSPDEPLGVLVGEQYAGTWMLELIDGPGFVDDGLLESCTLRIRPEWIRPLHFPGSGISVAKLKAKDVTASAKDNLAITIDVDAGGVPLQLTEAGRLRLIDSVRETIYLDIDLPPAVPGARPFEAEAAARVKAKLDLNRSGSSRGRVTVKVTSLDFRGGDVVPEALRVELVIGDAILTQAITTSNGKLAASNSPVFVVGKLKSKVGLSGARTTTVAGRFSPVPSADGLIELVVGSERVRLEPADVKVKGNKRIFKGGKVLKKLVVDLVKGTFSAKLSSDHEIRVGSTTPVSLRLGESFYGDTDVLPFDKGSKTQY